MASPAKGLSLSWKDVGFTVEVKVDKKPATKQILQGVTGVVRPGEMLAIMGTSGSGKTSMLNVLSGRHLKGGEVTGEVLVNGAKRGSTWNKQTAYVEQDDLMFAHLTVLETLTYTARLRCPGSMSRAQKEARAKEVIQQLGLSECQDTRIGDALRRGISGGERKRTSIGIELIAGPAIIFLDEPTSGLDAFTALHIMRTVKSLTLHGQSVVCSIHQPRDKIFQLFDSALVLTKGMTTYYGPRASITGFVSSVGHVCPPEDNFADFLLDITTVDTRTTAALEQTTATVNALQAAYEASGFRQQAEAQFASSSAAGAAVTGGERGWEQLESPNGWFSEFGILLSRAFLNVTRNPATTVAFVMQAVIMGLIVGGIFFGVGNEYDQKSIFDRQGLLFFATMNQAFFNLSTTLRIFHEEKQVFQRERASGAIRTSSYFWAKSVADIPIAVLTPILFSAILYSMAGLRAGAEHFFGFLLVLEMVVLSAQSWGIFISAATPSIEVGQPLGMITVILFMLFSGLYLNQGSIWIGFVWIEIFSFIQYGWTAFMVNEFDGLSGFDNCTQGNFCLQTGDMVLKQAGIADRVMAEEVAKMAGLVVLFRLMGLAALTYMHREHIQLETSRSVSTAQK